MEQIKTIKISELPNSGGLKDLYTIGVDDSKTSVKIPIGEKLTEVEKLVPSLIEKVNNETERAKAAEKRNADSVLSLKQQTNTSVTDLLAQVRQEVADRQAAISALDEALKQEVERATGEEQRLDRSKPEKEWITDFMINNNLTED